MARATQTHVPDDAYLLAIGQHAYMVTSMEGLLLFDLAGLAAHLPARLTPEHLAAKTTGAIGRELQRAAPDVRDDEVRAYIEAGGNSLVAAATARNHLLHSRPATHPDGRTRLHRWNPSAGQQPFWITDEWIAAQIDSLSEQQVRLNDLRPLHKNAAFGS